MGSTRAFDVSAFFWLPFFEAPGDLQKSRAGRSLPLPLEQLELVPVPPETCQSSSEVGPKVGAEKLGPPARCPC